MKKMMKMSMTRLNQMTVVRRSLSFSSTYSHTHLFINDPEPSDEYESPFEDDEKAMKAKYEQGGEYLINKM